MKKFICLFVTLFAITSLFAVPTPKSWIKGPDSSWYVQLEPALKAAKAANKKVYVLKTGSDWCPWCVRLKNDVFNKREFKHFAQKELILVYLDFPQRGNMPAAQKKYNQQTISKLKMTGGYPSALILDADGKVISQRNGYAKLKAYMNFLQDSVNKK